VWQRALDAGWQLLSYPVRVYVGGQPSTRVQDVLASLDGHYDVAWAYVASDPAMPWESYNPAAPPYASELTNLRLGQGFWVHLTSPATWRLEGVPVASTQIQLYTDYNLIGWPRRAARDLPAALSSIAGHYDLVWAYAGDEADPAWLRYAPAGPPWANSLSQMGPGWGYWIHVDQNCTLTVGP